MRAATVVGDRKSQIYRVASRLFRERGYHGTSVRDIAEAVGLTGASLYSHMAGKDELLWEIANRSADRFLAALRPIVEDEAGVMLRLRRAIIAHVEIITSDLDAAAVYTSEWLHLPKEQAAAFAARRDEYEELFRSLVRQGMREGLLNPVDVAYATRFILSALNFVYMWFRADGRMTSDEVANMLADFIFDGLRRRV